ncbi:MAG: hypothetical protein AB8B49_02970 [Nitratireductor sp.]
MSEDKTIEQKKQTSGLEKVPRILAKPFYTDRVFYWALATLAFWVALFYWIFK